MYLVGLEDCKNHLHGRIILSKETNSLLTLMFAKNLDLAWKSLCPWKSTPLVKGFREFVFASLEDIRKFLVVGFWNLNPGILSLCLD